MTAMTTKPGWVKPETILFASEAPVNETVFESALAQACEFHSKLILFHAYNALMVTISEASGICYYDFDGAARLEKQHLEPYAERARQVGVGCEVVVRLGLPDDRILAFIREREIDRIVMGTHSPSPFEKILVGSVAKSVLRHSVAPVYIVGPRVATPGSHDIGPSTVLCAASMRESSKAVARFAAQLAVQHEAQLALQHVIEPWKHAQLLAACALDQLETNLLGLVPVELLEKVKVRAIVTPGDPAEELLHHSRAQKAELIVMGAQGFPAFTGITRQGVVSRMITRAHCPVITLSSVAVAEYASEAKPAGEPYVPSGVL